MPNDKAPRRMTIFVGGEPVVLSPRDTRIRQALLQDAVRVTVERHRSALERLAKA